MNFEGLKEFLLSKMKLRQIYQPLVIKTLVEAGGSATLRQLAIRFLSHDESEAPCPEGRGFPVRYFSFMVCPLTPPSRVGLAGHLPVKSNI